MNKRELQKLWAKLGIPPEVAARAAKRIHPEARRLVFIGRAADDGRLLRLAPGAARAWHRLAAAADADGLTLLPLSAYRSVARQTRIIRRKLRRGDRIEDILRVNAVPGCSEHHTGRALDLGSPAHARLEVTFSRTREFRWLRQHATRLGFFLSYPRKNHHGINYEPWHWCWHPRKRSSRPA